MIEKSYDVVIIGGAVIGSAIAYFLSANPDFNGRILVVEKDPTYAKSSTALSLSSIRTQFSNPINVKISQFGVEFIRNFSETMAVNGDRPDLDFHECGYLFLANTEAQVAVLRSNHAVQEACGADVELWDRETLATAFPHLRVADILLASYGRANEGWFDNTRMMMGFRNKARAHGAQYISDEAIAIGRGRNGIRSVTLKNAGEIAVGTVVNASGSRAALTARMAGLEIPVEPRKRTIFVFDCADTPQGSAKVNQGRLPLMIDPTGVFCRPEGKLFLAGSSPAHDPVVDWHDFDPRYEEFETVIWPRLAERSANFEAIKVVNQWAGHYAFNTLDHNLIVGRHPELVNFIFANGFSGHGLQQAPATGRAVCELITYGEYRSLDFSEVGFERVIANRPFIEKAVI